MAGAAAIPDPTTISVNKDDSSAATGSAAAVKRTGGKVQKRTATSSSKSSVKGSLSEVDKPKQSKSRNGCLTCKAKRLKCDETKPSCQQCARRRVSCGGYKRDFKWRPFEEASFVSKSAPVRRREELGSPHPSPISTQFKYASTSNLEAHDSLVGEASLSDSTWIITPPQSASISYDRSQDAQFSEAMDMRYASSRSPVVCQSYSNLTTISAPVHARSVGRAITGSSGVNTLPSPSTPPSNWPSGQSPRLIELLSPGSKLSQRPPDSFSQQLRAQQTSVAPLLTQEGDDDVEEVVRKTEVPPASESWVMALPSTTFSGPSSVPEPLQLTSNPESLLLVEPLFSANSPEMLMLRFDRQTCGILSIKDGPTENPWRTLVWPLAKDCPALYHAVISMTSFHASKGHPQLRLHGIEHMRTSIQTLASGIAQMRTDAAIATTLTLAFSESWDQHISTGIDHIRGARALVNQVIMKARRFPFTGDELARMRFLFNTWVYMDVIARLTSLAADESDDFETVSSFLECDAQIDPLMGSASTLFPLIGRVANLVRRVRKTQANSSMIISQAAELKGRLESWVPPSSVKPPEDLSVHVDHSLQTAEAYRWATLLYLHQAVPEMPSMPSSELAKKVMKYLHAVPLTSRAVIVQIYPLIAAGSEAMDDEDRRWVSNRWQSMAHRMAIGVIDRCADVVKEVWRRRDVYEASRGSAGLPVTASLLNRGLSRGLPGTSKQLSSIAVGDCHADLMTPPLDYEYTVRGRLHWLGVMTDWKWEVLLG